MGTATRVGENRASEVDDRLGNKGAGSRTRLEIDEPSVPAGVVRYKGGGDTQTRTETEREGYRQIYRRSRRFYDGDDELSRHTGAGDV